MTLRINWPAVRAYRRLTQPLIEASLAVEEADAGFDAGEWSGPCHAARLEEDLVALERQVAHRFGLGRRELIYMVAAADDVERNRLFDAISANAIRGMIEGSIT